MLKGVDGGHGREEPGAWRLLGGENMRLSAVSGCLCSRLTACQLGAANTLLARPVPLLTSALPALDAAGGWRCCQGVEARLNSCCVT